MTFDDILVQALALVQRQGRVSYRALKRRFDLDEAYLEDLEEELLFAHAQLADELGMRPLLAHCHRRLGMLYAAPGQREQSAPHSPLP